MKRNSFVVLTVSSVLLLPFRGFAADNSLIGEWFPAENASSGLGGTRNFKTNGTVVVAYGAALHFKFQLETNGVTNTVLMPGPEGPQGPPVRLDFTITNDTLTLIERKGRQRQKLTRVKGIYGEGLFGQWTGKHYTGGQQVTDFTTNLYYYLSVPFTTITGSFKLNGNQLTEELQGKRVTSGWAIADDVLTLTPSTGGAPEKYRRKGAAFVGDETPFSERVPGELPRGIRITSESKTHVHANISKVRVEDFPALTNAQALFTVYFDGKGATDGKLEALSRLRFTNLACVVFTDCQLVTDTGIEYLSQIPTLASLGLRQMSITDVACNTMARKMRLTGVNMCDCTNVTVDGLLKMAQSETMEDLGFSVGQMTQEDLIRLISTAGPKLKRMDIEMVESAERRLDFAALRQAAEPKKIELFAVRNKHVKKL